MKTSQAQLAFSATFLKKAWCCWGWVACHRRDAKIESGRLTVK